MPSSSSLLSIGFALAFSFFSAGPGAGAEEAEESSAREVRIHKAERRLEFLERGVVVRTFRVSLGGAPIGDKVRQGDQRTPEGVFFVAWKNPTSQFHKFLGLSYPMLPHADRGLRDRRITAKQYREIKYAVERHGRPPQNTRLGGYVGIHGGGSGEDWTLGCIAVSDAEIDWLYQRLSVGDAVSIFP